MSFKISLLSELPPELTTLCDMARGEGFGMLDRLVTGFKTEANTFTRRGEALFGAAQDGKLVGIGGLNIDPYFDEPDVGRLRHLYVHPDYRCIGVGRRLNAEIERAAKGYFGKLQLFTSSKSASHFYEALGFKPVIGVKKVSHFKLLCSMS